ncbi:MAG: hypothetical protein LBJ02_03625 [Bifidobacteriaceae bacterium]|jgi:hypothetical protein|nr:hypothetical protein [Bifidobacteriaceae bacterium]
MRGLGARLALSAVALGTVLGSAILSPLAGAQAAITNPFRPVAAAGENGLSGAEPAPSPSAGNEVAEAAGGGEPGGAVGWALSPANGPLGNHRPHYNYLVAPGGSIDDGIVIESRASEPLRLKVYAADAYTTPDGLLDLSLASETPSDAGAWVTFGEPFPTPAALEEANGPEPSADGEREATWPGLVSTELTLEPATSVTVPLRWSIPADASPGDHAGGIVTSLAEDPAAASVRVDRRLALRAYLNLNGQIDPGLTISDLRVKASGSINPFTSGSLKVTYTLTNTGSARLVPTERIDVHGPFGWGGRDGADGSVLPEILPGSYLAREVTVAGVFPLMRTTTEVTVDAVAVGLGAEGASASASRASTIWTVPWVWLGLLVALLAAAAVIPLRRRRREMPNERHQAASV